MTRIPRLVLAAAIMGAAIWFALGYLSPYLSSQTPLYTQAAALGLLIAAAAIVYFAVAFGIGGADIGMIRRNIRRKGGGTPDVTESSSDP
jgi:putative peptidoglycan lipid II flippase